LKIIYIYVHLAHIFVIDRVPNRYSGINASDKFQVEYNYAARFALLYRLVIKQKEKIIYSPFGAFRPGEGSLPAARENSVALQAPGVFRLCLRVMSVYYSTVRSG
jgi:hypothetical protein